MHRGQRMGFRNANGKPQFSAGGGPVETVPLNVDLDATRKGQVMKPVGEDGKTVFPRKIPVGDPDNYELTIKATDSDYSFDIELGWEDASSSGTILL